MKNILRGPLLVIVLAHCCVPVYSQDATPNTELTSKLKAIPGVVEVRAMPQNGAAQEVYEVSFEQPVDHQNSAGDKFRQRVFVSHVGYDRPVLLSTEGYAANRVGGSELQRILGGNQVTVEHRYFGKSVPSPIRWEYLTVKQSADDLHAIVSALHSFYTGKWVSSGAIKGGQSALFYKCYYPKSFDFPDN